MPGNPHRPRRGGGAMGGRGQRRGQRREGGARGPVSFPEERRHPRASGHRQPPTEHWACGFGRQAPQEAGRWPLESRVAWAGLLVGRSQGSCLVGSASWGRGWMPARGRASSTRGRRGAAVCSWCGLAGIRADRTGIGACGESRGGWECGPRAGVLEPRRRRRPQWGPFSLRRL